MEKITCKHCGTKYAAGVAKCPVCGSSNAPEIEDAFDFLEDRAENAEVTARETQPVQETAQQTQPEDDMRQALSRLLSSMEGVGRVELLQTTTDSDEVVYQTDVRRSGETSEETTVFSANQSAQKTPVVTKTKKASYAGAVVVCDGADSAVVRLRIVQAVSALTGLGSDKISVIKMKQS